MITQIPVQEDNIVAFRVTGKLTHEDYQAFLPQLEELIKAQPGRLSLLFELQDFHGWDLHAAVDDFRCLEQHEDDFERIAVVGENRLERWMTAMSSPFVTAEVRFFGQDQLGAAWDWLREPAGQADEDKAAVGPYRQILVATDLSPQDERLLARARQLASASGARIHLVHAVDYPIYYDEAYDPVIAVDTEGEMINIAKGRMNDLLEKTDAATLSGEVISGPPKSVILSQAEALDADLIVMGKHSHGALGRLLGSTTNGVMHHARCEVLSIPLQEG